MERDNARKCAITYKSHEHSLPEHAISLGGQPRGQHQKSRRQTHLWSGLFASASEKFAFFLSRE